MSTGALAIGLLAEAIKAGLQIYQAQGFTEQQARELVLRDMDAAATRAGLAELGWQARKRPLSKPHEVPYEEGQPGADYVPVITDDGRRVWRQLSQPIPSKDMPAVLPSGPVNPEDAGDGA